MTDTPRPKVPRPAGALLTKSAGGGRGGANGANDSTIFVAFPGGMVRRLTELEYACWDDVTIDRYIPVGKEHDNEFAALAAYDAALRA